MRSRRAVLTALALAAAAGALPPAAAAPRPGVTTRVSVATGGAQGNNDAAWVTPAMTPDGRYVAFVSNASNLVAGDLNNSPDVFLRDRRRGVTRLVSVGITGRSGHVVSPICGGGGVGAVGANTPSISADGRYVAFASCFDDLVVGDRNLNSDIFVRDMRTGHTTLVSVSSTGVQGNGVSYNPSMSADGRYVAFDSGATNLAPGTCPADPEGQVLCALPTGGAVFTSQRVFVRDLVAGTTTLVSVTSKGELADGASYFPSISPDGRYVAFTSMADNLAPNDTNAQCTLELAGTAPSCTDVFLRDLKARRTELISVAIDGHSGMFGSATAPSTVAVSRGGRYVAFKSSAHNLVPNANALGVYVRDRLLGRTRRVSVTSSGGEMQIGDGSFGMSADGRFVTFDDAQTMPQCSPQPVQVVRHDLAVGATETEDRVDYAGHEVGCADYYNSSQPAVSPDGRLVAFVTNGSNLVRGDTNGKFDVFVRDRGPSTGVGVVAGSARIASGPVTRAAVLSRPDVAGDVSSALAGNGLDLTGAELVARPWFGDVLVRTTVSRMPLFAVADPAVVYAVRFTARGVGYEIRAAKTGPAAASFGLWRQVSSGWSFVGSLDGGYGTTGQEVVVAVPLSALAAGPGTRLSGLSSYAGFGTYAAGITTVIDGTI